MRRTGTLGAICVMLMAAPQAGAQQGRITFWDGTALRAEIDPQAAPQARRTEIQNEATMLSRDVGLFIEPDLDAPVYASNLVAVALTRRLMGQAPVDRALGAARVFTLRPKLSAAAGRVIVDWRFFNEQGAAVAAMQASAAMSGAPEAGDPFAAFTPADAERIAFQTAAMIEDSPDLAAAIAAAKALTALAETPIPAARPFEEKTPEDPPAVENPPAAPAPAESGGAEAD
ncbi:MAG: hypothetical protein ACK5MQ_01115 [Pikeienuella sp.]